MKKPGVFVIITILIVLGIGYIYINGIHTQTSQGEHIGFVTAVERNGIFFKTGTAYVKTETDSSQEDSYCFVSADVENKLHKAANSKENVRITYIDWLVRGIRNCDDYDVAIVTDISSLD